MRKLIFVLVALLTFTGAAAAFTSPAYAAPRGNAFCKLDGTPTPSRLAALVRQSLDKDPSGNTPLDPVACHEARPATPNEIYMTLNVSDPDAHMTSALGLQIYLKSLIKVKVEGKYYSACLALGTKGWYPLTNCVARNLHPHEFAWGNPRTHKPVLQGDCSNPMQQPEQQEGCVDVIIPVRKGDEVRIHNTGPTDIAREQCTGLLRAGESDFESPFVEHCFDVDCTFTDADEATDAPSWGIGSWVAKQDGYAIVREPAKVADENAGDYRLWVCVRRKDGTQSCGVGVRWFDYGSRTALVPSGVPKRDQLIATIYRNLTAFVSAGSPQTRIGTPSILWLDWTCPW